MRCPCELSYQERLDDVRDDNIGMGNFGSRLMQEAWYTLGG